MQWSFSSFVKVFFLVFVAIWVNAFGGMGGYFLPKSAKHECALQLERFQDGGWVGVPFCNHCRHALQLQLRSLQTTDDFAERSVIDEVLEPMLLLSNDLQKTARNLIIRYGGRNREEDGLGSAVNFFHLDCLASEVRLNVDLDCALTVVANGCYRWLAKQLKGFEKAHAKQLFRRFVEIARVVEVAKDQVTVHFDRRSHNPIVREASLDQNHEPIPWLQNRTIHFDYS
jgi:hypothetical protein